MTRDRIPYIDLGAGIMILWMIVMHAISTASWIEIELYGLSKVTDASLIPEGVHAVFGKDGHIHDKGMIYYIPYFLFFFMQWFFYKSGQFFVKRDIRDEWKMDWRKLIRYFVIWSAVGYILYVLFLGIDGALTLRKATYDVVRCFFFNGYISGNLPLWFLITLFGVKQLANVILPAESDKYYWLKCVAIILIGYMIAFILFCMHNRYIPRWIANGSAGIAFFTLGYCMNKYETKWWVLLPCVLIYVACCIWGFPNVGVFSNTSGSVVKYLICLPCAFAGIISFNEVCRLVSRYVHHISMPFEQIGKFAMIIYVSHGILYGLVKHILISFGITQYMSFACALWIILGTYCIFIPIFCYLSVSSLKRIHIFLTRL